MLHSALRQVGRRGSPAGRPGRPSLRPPFRPRLVWLEDRTSLWLAVIAAGLLFGAGHWLSASYAVLASLIGVYLGLLFVVSGNLLAPIVAHAAYDVVALYVLARRLGAGRG